MLILSLKNMHFFYGIFLVWGIFMNYVPGHAAVESALTVWRSVPALPPFLKHALILFWRCLGWKCTIRSIWDLWNRLLLLRICLNFFSNYFLFAATQHFPPHHVRWCSMSWKLGLVLFWRKKIFHCWYWSQYGYNQTSKSLWYKLLWRDFDVSEVLQNNLLCQPG